MCMHGIMFKLSFPYARGVTADLLLPIVWESVRRLEARGLKVLCITADGASPNSKFLRMHHVKTDPGTSFHKARNPYSPDNRWVYFVSDPTASHNDGEELLVTFWGEWNQAYEGSFIVTIINVIVLLLL